MGYKFYGNNLSIARRLRHEIQDLLSKKRMTQLGGRDHTVFDGLIVEKRKELNGLIVKGEPFELYKGLEIGNEV